MLIAKDAQGELYSCLDQVIERRIQYYCPACSGPLVFKSGAVMRSHFAHQSLKDCQFFHENESSEHLSLKAQLYSSLAETEKVEIEKVLPDIQQIADLMVNDRLALEVQCSPLSIERLRERTNSYQEVGIQVLWLLGKRLWMQQRLTDLQRQLLYFSSNMGFHLWELDADQSLIRLKYLIYEDWQGKVHYLEQQFPLAAHVIDVFRIPYRSQKIQTYQRACHLDLLNYIQRQLQQKKAFWMSLQEAAYLRGDNLLTRPLDSFYPQIRFPKSDHGFCQIKEDLAPFYQAFNQFYEKVTDKRYQVLYPPAVYVKMKSDLKEKRSSHE
ncbi:competence protein CoiA [Streptococcus saliviloxodontae]|uniref:Competence protein CoiA n=1 Tax=Streptococcus saliviloxodontae TaxID=1349416 RepID=A0ABS2PMB5_9STRE|nr:competence protein CoiA [Streptococcus saliviloxodontae]